MNSKYFLRLGQALLFGCVVAVLFTQVADSASRTRYGSFSNSSDDSELEEAREWGRQSSQTRRKINQLDEEIVSKIPIPILFGVELSDLYPNFGDARDGGARSHMGLDIMSPEGTPIVSPTEAVVLRVGTGANSGKYVYTANPGGETFVYMHLSQIADIDSGDLLEEGDVIGYVGNTGNTSGGPAHLHFEIRESREALDPYLRIKKTFFLKNKIKYLDNVFDDSKDDDELAEFLVSEFYNEFAEAVVEDIDLPKDINDAMKSAGGSLSGTETAKAKPGTVPVRDLQIGAQGDDVVWLQRKLIEKNLGSASRALANVGPTGYFGTLTQASVSEYQVKYGISPSVGYFGPITRAHILK